MGTHPIFESDFDCLTDMSIVLPRTLTRDLEKFDQRDFAAVPKWAILRNHTGLQVQLFWEAKEQTSVDEPDVVVEGKKVKKRSKRKRSPQRILQSDDDIENNKSPPSDDMLAICESPLDQDEPTSSSTTSSSTPTLTASMLSQLTKSWSEEASVANNNLIQRQLESLINSTTLDSTRPRARRSPAPRFYPMTDPVVKFLQETLVEDTQGRVACADLSGLSGQKFGNPINMVSMGMKLRFLYPAVTRVKINNRAFYTNVSVRDTVQQSTGDD